MRKLLLLSAAVGAALAGTAARADDQSSTTLSGLMYADFTSISTTQDSSANPPIAKLTVGDIDPKGFGTDVKRFYVGVTHVFDDTWSANVTTDFSGTAPNVFIKKAYVQAKFSDAAVLSLGSNNNPWIPFVEGIYGYRFVENTLTDKEKIGNSADWGAHLNGTLGGTFSYDVAAVNGNGYKNPSRSKTPDFELRGSLVPVSGLTLAVGYYTGYLGQDTQTAENNNSALTKNTANRTDFLVDWKSNGLNVGLEYVTAKNFAAKYIFSNPTVATSTDSQQGYSLFASYDLTSDYSVFGRYDSYKPAKDNFSSEKDTYYNAGFAWKSNSNITWAFVYKSDKLENNLQQATDDNDLKQTEYGIWAQVKF